MDEEKLINMIKEAREAFKESCDRGERGYAKGYYHGRLVAYKEVYKELTGRVYKNEDGYSSRKSE